MDLADAPVLLPSSSPIYRDGPMHSMEHDFSDGGDNSGSARNSSGPDEAVFDHILDDDIHSSPGTSHQSDDEISELPTDSRVPSCTMDPEESIIYTPKKKRSPFRNPSSVRALQLDTTPPHLRSGSARNKYRTSNVSRNSTPKSTRSFHSGMRSARNSPAKQVRTEHPLVLLHVTLIPSVCPYSQEIMESVLPASIIDNWKLLREKISDTVLERGILIPHPREDYDMLEERLLESLELKTPRILKCGHFHLSPEEEEDILASGGEYDSDADGDMCEDCGRRVRDGQYGSGSGTRRWNIKIYASNGMMRAGAWAAAWREMERVDVEILPWMEESMKRELEMRKEEEASKEPPPPPRQSPPSPPNNMAEERRREIYGEDAQAFVDGLAGTPPPQPKPAPERQHKPEPPLTELLTNYVQLLMQDRRNIVILVLSIMILFFAAGLGKAPAPPSLSPAEAVMPQIATQAIPQAAIPSKPFEAPRRPVVPKVKPSKSAVKSQPPTESKIPKESKVEAEPEPPIDHTPTSEEDEFLDAVEEPQQQETMEDILVENTPEQINEEDTIIELLDEAETATEPSTETNSAIEVDG